MFGITVKLPPGHVGELPVNPDDDSPCVGDGCGSFYRHFPRRIRVACDLVDVVRHGPDETLQVGKLHELISSFRGVSLSSFKAASISSLGIVTRCFSARARSWASSSGLTLTS
jgi:hypothetical protein